jgi:hypothetical protein
MGDVEAALAANRAAHEGQVHAVGRRHPRTLYASADVGMSLAATGDFGTAETLLAATLAAQSEVLGGEHPHTRRTAEALAALRAQDAGVAAVTGQEEPTATTSQG